MCLAVVCMEDAFSQILVNSNESVSKLHTLNFLCLNI